MLSAARFGQHPRPVGHRRLVTHVLPVAAGQIRHPIAMFVLVVSRDRLVHPLGPGACRLQWLKRPFRHRVGGKKCPMARNIDVERSDEQQISLD